MTDISAFCAAHEDFPVMSSLLKVSIQYHKFLRLIRIAAQGECTDLRGRHISHGLHYVPGPDTCTLCVCDNGLPKVCKAVLCSPPQDCRSFRVGNTCCEFICLDDVVKPAEGEAGVRLAAGGAAALVVATVALVVYRVRTHKRRRPPRLDDQRSLTSIGYISGSMGYMGGTCETALAAWKPPSNYLPRGEAPPPYDEAVAQCRNDAMRMNNESFHRSYAGMEGDMQCSGHAYVNITRPVQQIANTQNCYNAPLLQDVHAADARDTPIVPHHALPPNVVGFPSTIRLTGSLGAISGRGVQVSGAGQTAPPAPPHADHERPHNVPGFYTHAHPIHTSLHRTIPRISSGMETSVAESMSGFLRADRSACGEVRRSFHRAGEPRLHTGRSMPRNLNMAAYTSNYNVTNIDLALEHTNGVRVNGTRSRAHSEEQNVGGGGGGLETKGAKATQDAATAPPPAAAPAAIAQYQRPAHRARPAHSTRPASRARTY
ncbi:Integral membrane protein DGCR2/IDD [Papilio xuthus]|uniref:Integral membrane protein DGCR2/IDD n=1 Tax=Papilio xuthus TaxID=66420 RepID=A0A194PYG0_PAPXU|nr:Integral membrane protein DGCR2/IDD [Papilio xuthus]